MAPKFRDLDAIKDAARADLDRHGDERVDAEYFALSHERQHIDLHERLKKLEPRTWWGRARRYGVATAAVLGGLLTGTAEIWKAYKTQTMDPIVLPPPTGVATTAVDRKDPPDAGRSVPDEPARDRQR